MDQKWRAQDFLIWGEKHCSPEAASYAFSIVTGGGIGRWKAKNDPDRRRMAQSLLAYMWNTSDDRQHQMIWEMALRHGLGHENVKVLDQNVPLSTSLIMAEAYRRDSLHAAGKAAATGRLSEWNTLDNMEIPEHLLNTFIPKALTRSGGAHDIEKSHIFATWMQNRPTEDSVLQDIFLNTQSPKWDGQKAFSFLKMCLELHPRATQKNFLDMEGAEIKENILSNFRRWTESLECLHILKDGLEKNKNLLSDYLKNDACFVDGYRKILPYKEYFPKDMESSFMGGLGHFGEGMEHTPQDNRRLFLEFQNEWNTLEQAGIVRKDIYEKLTEHLVEEPRQAWRERTKNFLLRQVMQKEYPLKKPGKISKI